MTRSDRRESECGPVPITTEVLQAFFGESAQVSRIRMLGDGRINDTYLVELGGQRAHVLQRINSAVFPDPVCVAENVGIVTAHLLSRSGSDRFAGERFARIVPTRDGTSCTTDRFGRVWRVFEYVTDTVGRRRVESLDQAFEVGRILGRFHRLLDDFDSSQLCRSLPGFHDLPGYCLAFDRAAAGYRQPVDALLHSCCRQVSARHSDAVLLVVARDRGDLSERVIHGDPKCDNILFDRQSGKAVAIIDFDTVARGLVLHDLGDCLRSLCNPAGETADARHPVCFDLSLCRAVLAGYRASGAVLSANEQQLIYQGVRLITLELGIRFLTDYLEGDRYFKVVHRRDNLQRAAVQLALLDQIEEHRAAIEALVSEVWR